VTRRRILLALLSATALVAMAGGCDPDDPCAGRVLPPCPPPCTPADLALCGTPCAEDGSLCGNEVGDGVVCQGGTYLCFVHAPLGTDCNRVCEP
jgi:hypothetical protein